jgi:hypothetical protein
MSAKYRGEARAINRSINSTLVSCSPRLTIAFEKQKKNETDQVVNLSISSFHYEPRSS